ncbi:hypothetical protein Hanom_Chr04g00345841 [Helianthus anomalus]
MPSNMFDSFAGFFGEPTTGFCPQYEAEKTPVQEILNVSKEINEEMLKEIVDKALMVKLQEVDQTETSSDNNETKEITKVSVSVKKESNEKSKSDGKSEIEKSKSGEESESESVEIGKTGSKNDKQEKDF